MLIIIIIIIKITLEGGRAREVLRRIQKAMLSVVVVTFHALLKR